MDPVGAGQMVVKIPGERAGVIAMVFLLLLIPLAAYPAAAGDRSASLTISGNIQISGVSADFIGTPRNGPAPLTVQFTDLSKGKPTVWSWDLDGDGSIDSTKKNPSFVYHHAGGFPVTLTVSHASGSDTETKPDYIGVSEPGALSRVRSLQQYVAGMDAGGWTKWLLTIPLEGAERQIRRGNDRAAAAHLRAFSHRVEFYERFRLITARDAAYLQEEAAIVRELLEE